MVELFGVNEGDWNGREGAEYVILHYRAAAAALLLDCRFEG